MTATFRTDIGPALGDTYPPFKAAMEEYVRLVDDGQIDLAMEVWREAQLMAKSWRAGCEYGRRTA